MVATVQNPIVNFPSPEARPNNAIIGERRQGGVKRWFATATDIEDRKQTEQRLRNENLVLREQIERDSMFEDIVGSSGALNKVLRQVCRVLVSNEALKQVASRANINVPDALDSKHQSRVERKRGPWR